MEIRDVIHGSIVVDPAELPVVDSPYFQRLRQIRQLGFGEHSYPSATHNRYIHSLGAMETATRVFDRILANTKEQESKSLKNSLGRFRKILRLSALLHDIGHGPLSHTTEFAMPDVSSLGGFGKAKRPVESRKATHEDYTLKIILDSPLTPILEKLGRPHGFTPLHIASLIDPTCIATCIEGAEDDFFFDKLGEFDRVNFRPMLQQLISSELDADRMDYLRRDSWYAGVSYGQFDFEWLANNLLPHQKDGSLYLALQHKALFSFEDFLISRFHMFLMVYFHYKSVIYDEMLSEYLGSKDCAYKLPSDIERYLLTHDAELYGHLSESKNPWARRIIEKNPYKILIEHQSGVPATTMAAKEQARQMAELKDSLKKQGIHFISSTSTGELSKYFRKKEATPIFVRYDNQYNAPNFIPLEECTDLFKRYGEKRLITRLYVSPEDNVKIRNQGQIKPFRYEEGA